MARSIPLEQSTLLDYQQAAARLGTSPGHMQRLVKLRQIPFVRVGKFVRFRIGDLDNWVAAHVTPEVHP